MPASTHPSFKRPDNLNARIWRYMDFTKFVSMLQTSGLWFSRTDLLGDPFEGSTTQQNILLEQAILAEAQQNIPAIYANYVPTIPNVPDILAMRSKTRKAWNQASFINCWHLSKYESAAMWRLYSKTNESVAIVSDYYRLFNSLEEDCFVGLVEYIDYDKEFDPSKYVRPAASKAPILHTRERTQSNLLGPEFN